MKHIVELTIEGDGIVDQVQLGLDLLFEGAFAILLIHKASRDSLAIFEVVYHAVKQAERQWKRFETGSKHFSRSSLYRKI